MAKTLSLLTLSALVVMTTSQTVDVRDEDSVAILLVELDRRSLVMPPGVG